MQIDIDSLKSDLQDYYGTAMQYNPMAMMDLAKLDSASNNEVVNMAIKNGFNLYDYEVNDHNKTR